MSFLRGKFATHPDPVQGLRATATLKTSVLNIHNSQSRRDAFPHVRHSLVQQSISGMAGADPPQYKSAFEANKRPGHAQQDMANMRVLQSCLYWDLRLSYVILAPRTRQLLVVSGMRERTMGMRSRCSVLWRSGLSGGRMDRVDRH
jgi:hypothetical protein